MVVFLHALLTSLLDRGKWSASRLGRLSSRARGPGTHWIGCFVGTRSGLNAAEKSKIFYPCREPIPRLSSRGLVAISTELQLRFFSETKEKRDVLSKRKYSTLFIMHDCRTITPYYRKKYI
jgi:hypothetical protein